MFHSRFERNHEKFSRLILSISLHFSNSNKRLPLISAAL